MLLIVLTATAGAAAAIVVSPATLPDAQLGMTYSAQLSASGGTGGYVFTELAVPNGLAVTAMGGIEGTPTVCSTEGAPLQVSVSVMDSGGETQTAAIGIYVNCSGLKLTPTTVPDGTLGAPYLQTLVVTGAAGPFTFVQDGVLPPGLSFDNGALSGTPTAAGAFTFRIRATKLTTGASTIRQYTIVVAAASITVVPEKLPDGAVGEDYAPQSFTASGGTAPYTFALTKGGGTGLAKGLSMDASGSVSGVPGKVGDYTFLVTATDANGAQGSVFATLTINGEIVVNPPKLPDSTVGANYSQKITATGGIGPYTFKRLSGTLPPGLSLRANGRLSGVPEKRGVFSFRVGATDSTGLKGQRNYRIRIGPVDPTDPDLLGIIIEEHRAARRSARTQIGSITGRLRAIRAGDCATFSYGIAIQDASGRTPAAASGQAGTAANADDALAARLPDTRCDDEDPARVRAWTAGNVQIGSTDADRLSPMVDILSSGLTAGIDYRFNAGAVGGIAVGFGRERADIGSEGTRLDTQSLSAAVYGTFAPTESSFIDTVAGLSRLDFDRRRYVSAIDRFSDGDRSATQAFASLGGGYRHDARSGWHTEFSGRLDGAVTWFDRSRDHGAGDLDAIYDAETDVGLDGVLSIMTHYPIPLSFGVLTPRGGLEYRHAFLNG
ncbi:MAG TPA: putative Ig domain-containing protein, partial [Methylomirabilota bacterium]|nr:putative Ig domain-containing protein [Methylomirabilota bacterium]